MRITIELEDSQIYGLSPIYVYKQLKNEHHKNLKLKFGDYFWGMEDTCDKAARELYSRLIKRPLNAKNLVITYSDAEACFKIYESFADVWVSNMTKAFEDERRTVATVKE